MSFAALAFHLLGRRMSLSARAALSEALLQREAATEFRGIFQRIVRFVVIAETAGAVLIFIGMLPAKGARHAAYSAVFHAVSAFCNAGFSLYPDSLTGWRNNPMVISSVMVLIVLGGIGHPVVVDVGRKLRAAKHRRESGPSRLELNSSVALVTSGADAGVIKKQAVAEGMATLRDDGIRKALMGTTSLDEVMRVTQDDVVELD